MNVGIKFCGHCRPYVDMTHVLDLMKKQAPDMNFVFWNKQYEVLLVMHACPGNCTTMPPFTGPRLEISANSFNFVRYERLDELAKAVVAALRDIKTGQEQA